MTYKEAQIQAYTDVEASSEALIKTMLSNYQEAKAFIRNELTKLYSTLAGVNPKDWYNHVIKIDRLQSLLDSIDLNYKKYAALADSQTESLISDAMRDMYYRTQYIHAAFMPEVISLTVLPEAFVKAAVTGQAEAMKAITEGIIERYKRIADYMPQYGTLTKLLADRNYEAVASIQQTVTQAMLKGQSIRDLSENIESCFETISWKATRIARTEALRVSSVGQYAYTQDLQNAGIKTQKMWLHVMSTTRENREAHEHLDGKTIDFDKHFKSNNHPALYPRGFGVPSEDINCRCTYVNIVDGVGPATRTATDPQTGKREIFSFKNYDDWAKEKGVYNEP